MPEEKKIIFEAYIEDNKVQIRVVRASEKALAILTYAQKLLDMEITRQLIEAVYKDDRVVIPASELKDFVQRN